LQRPVTSEAFTQNSLATHSLTRAVAFGRIIVVPARAYVRDVTTAIDQREDKSAHISTTEVSFCTIIICSTQCTTAISMV